jgi:hypothetical protein
VTLVVDFNELGGGTQVVCDAGGGGDTAASLFPANGFPLTYAQRQPGYVCRVSGVPTSDPCVNTSPADAYWGLWWSDGESGSWTYSSLGAGSLRIPDGGYVAFAWDQVDGQQRPSANPAAHPSQPTPTPTPTPTAGSSPSTGGGGGSGGHQGGSGGGGGDNASPTPSTSTSTPSSGPSATPSDPASESAGSSGSPSGRPSRSPSAAESSASAVTEPTPSSTAAEAAPDTAPASAESGDDSLPVWVAPTLIGLIFVAVGATLWHRRRTP